MAENGQGSGMPQISVMTQYTKDFSFENPKAPDSLMPRDKPPEIQINVNVGHRPFSDTDHEISLVIAARARHGEDVLFSAELDYAGLFRIENVTPETLYPVLMIECPRLLFPFARQIVSDATRAGGFPPLMIDPIDFVALYQTHIARLQQQMHEQQGQA